MFLLSFDDLRFRRFRSCSVSTVFLISMQAAGSVELPESPKLPNIAEAKIAEIGTPLPFTALCSFVPSVVPILPFLIRAYPRLSAVSFGFSDHRITRSPDHPISCSLRCLSSSVFQRFWFSDVRVFSASPRLRGVLLLFRSPDHPITRSPDLASRPMPRHRAQFQHLQRTLRPIMFPAHNHVAPVHWMQV